MKLWDLPGAKEFVDFISERLRSGYNVVVRFAAPEPPSGFDSAIAAATGSAFDLCLVPATDSPLRDIASRCSSSPNTIDCLPQLFSSPGFQARLLRPEGIDSRNWPQWRDFLASYASATRSQPLLKRSPLLVTLTGNPPPEPPLTEAGIVNVEWGKALDEVDILMLANQKLRRRSSPRLLRALLAATVAHVAAWDDETASMLAEEDNETIMAPTGLLREMAQERAWSHETPIGWEHGTASHEGVVHPAIAALDDPPAELKRRLWGAQISVLLPWIEQRRRDIVQSHVVEIRAYMRANGAERSDPFDLELPDLHRAFAKRRISRDGSKSLSLMRSARNRLAHGDHLALSTVMRLMDA